MRSLTEVLPSDLSELGDCVLNWKFHKPVTGLKQRWLKKAIPSVGLSLDQELIVPTTQC